MSDLNDPPAPGTLPDARGFLIDLDGVLYVGDHAVDGAPGTIAFLADNGYPFRCVSNTTRKSRRTIARHLASLGIPVPEKHIFTPAMAAVAFMKETGRRSFFLLVTGDVEKDFNDPDLQVDKRQPELVVIGDAGDRITYTSMNTAFRLLMGGADLIALEYDRYWMAPDGLSLGAGPFVRALEFAAGKTARIMGKPSPDFFHLALRDMDLRPEQVVMIGDDILTDVGGAVNAGMNGILVRTGKYRPEVLASAAAKPAIILDSIAQLPDLIRAWGR
jgi:HAD superfamily hydrolase (TIGR01458 family)